MSAAEINFMSAIDIARRGRLADITARQVVEAFLSSIEDLQPRLNAFTQILSDIALDQARSVDEAVRAGRRVGLHADVLVAVKDIVADEFGVPIDDIQVVCGDTAITPMGWGTYGS